jgi:UDP-glucuronate 4-epimerase
VSLYAATKRADELLSISYARIFRLPQTGLRFFTVYGPWGRPDMAMWLFTKAMLAGHPIKVFNHGKMQRDFTYIDDIIQGVVGSLFSEKLDSYEVFNIGNHRSENLLDMIGLLGQALGVTPKMEFLPLQPGDVPATYANIDSIHAKIGYEPTTPISVGIPKFVAWYTEYHKANGEAPSNTISPNSTSRS